MKAMSAHKYTAKAIFRAVVHPGSPGRCATEAHRNRAPRIHSMPGSPHDKLRAQGHLLLQFKRNQGHEDISVFTLGC